MKGIVFDIRRFCVHDGPGIRTTVFLKGCPLHCRWCHNPESQEKRIEFVKKEIVLDGNNICKEVQIGKEMSVEEVIEAVQKDIVFYNESGGGVTFSGGEPLNQPEFLLHLLKRSKEIGLHTAVDTCGYAGAREIEKIAFFTDLFLFDLKHHDPAIHLQFTGVDNRLILQNLEKLTKLNKRLIIRIPLIPGFNDSIEVMASMADQLNNLNGSIKEIHLLPYHSMAKAKYSMLSMNFSMAEFEKVQDNNIIVFKELLSKEGFTTNIGG